MNIYVANIPWKASEEQLKTLFSEYGEVSSAKIIMDMQDFGLVNVDVGYHHDRRNKGF